MTVHSPDFYQKEYDVYIEETPLEARFDPLTIQCLVLEAVERHEAYGLFFDDYLKKRMQFIGYDESEKKRLSFYLPVFPALRTVDFAVHYRLSITRFMVLLIEIGFINFNYDYNEEMQKLKFVKKQMSSYLSNAAARVRYLQLDNRKITLCHGSPSSGNGSKHFTPHVQEWLYNAINDASSHLNMTISDMVYLSWCIGAQKTLPNEVLDPMLGSDISEIIDIFNISQNIHLQNIEHLLSQIKVDGELLH